MGKIICRRILFVLKSFYICVYNFDFIKNKLLINIMLYFYIDYVVLVLEDIF